MSRITKACSHLSEQEIRARLKETKDWGTHRKLLVVLNAPVDPRCSREIALHTAVPTPTVHIWISTYNRFGFDARVGPGRGGRRKAMMSKEEQAAVLAPFFERARTGRIATVTEIGEAMRNRVGHSVHETSVYRFLKRNGWAKVKPRPVHVRTDARAQEKFPEQVSNIVAQTDPQDKRPVAIMSQDEGRFGRINDHRPCWAPKGMRPKAPRQIVRAFVSVYAAICMALGKFTSLILPYAKTEMMNLFLQGVAQDFKDFFVIMLIDQAGWHKSKTLIIPENIGLIAQPPHSPELNPVEHLWEDLRENAMPNAAFKSLDQVEQALCCRLVDLENDPERPRSMTNFPYPRNT